MVLLFPSIKICKTPTGKKNLKLHPTITFVTYLNRVFVVTIFNNGMGPNYVSTNCLKIKIFVKLSQHYQMIIAFEN